MDGLRFVIGFLFQVVCLAACGARSGLWIPDLETEITAEPNVCSAYSAPPTCAICRNAACSEKAPLCGDECIEIQLCAQKNCYGLDLDGWEPGSPLNMCVSACAEPFGDEAFGGFLWYVGCARNDTPCADKCTRDDDYKLCRDALGTCATEAEIAKQCMLLWWIEGENKDGWSI